MVCYKNIKSKIIIICQIHGYFEQTPGKHLQGQIVRNAIDALNINYGGHMVNYVFIVNLKIKINCIKNKKDRNC